MPRLLSRAALAGAAFQQAKKFLDSPRGRQLAAQAKAKAKDPATRAKVNEVVSGLAGQVSKVRSRVADR